MATNSFVLYRNKLCTLLVAEGLNGKGPGFLSQTMGDLKREMNGKTLVKPRAKLCMTGYKSLISGDIEYAR